MTLTRWLAYEIKRHRINYSAVVARLTSQFTLSQLHLIHHQSSAINMTTDSDSQCKWVAVCQMTATNDKLHNLEVCGNMIRDSSSKGAKMVFLPECFDFVGESKAQSVEMAEPLNGFTIEEYRKLAKELKVWLSLGGFHEKGPPEHPNKIFNAHLIIDDLGEIEAVYRKTHLFNVDIKDGVTLRETEHTIPGSEILPPVDTPVGKVALQICYDLRFPEESIVQTQLGAQILTFPSAFTMVTGMAHWEVLLRARAIENQCYVIAAAQTGEHNKSRRSYGHSMVIDPWGAIIAQCQEGTGYCLAKLDLKYLWKIRNGMPVWKHRRYDLYDNPLNDSLKHSS